LPDRWRLPSSALGVALLQDSRPNIRELRQPEQKIVRRDPRADYFVQSRERLRLFRPLREAKSLKKIDLFAGSR
jgi:hypothetical protein